MKNSIKFADTYPHGHICTQFCPWQMENSVRFAYISIRADGK